MHLREWIELLIDGGLEVTVLHPPGEPAGLPAGAGIQPLQLGSGAWERIRYEQGRLPAAAGQLGCDAMLVAGGSAAVSARVPVLALGRDRSQAASGGALDRIRAALGRAGSLGARATLLHSDLAAQEGSGWRFSPFVSPEVGPHPSTAEDAYVLCYGPDPADVPMALAAWTWVDGSLGDAYPLLFADCPPALEEQIRNRAQELDVSDSIRFETNVSWSNLPALFRDAAVYLHLSFAAWGQPLRWALVSGTPVAGVGSPDSSSILQEAGYLVAAQDARGLGAACLSLLVQQNLAEELRAKGSEIASSFVQPETRVAVVKLVYDALGGNA